MESAASVQMARSRLAIYSPASSARQVGRAPVGRAVSSVLRALHPTQGRLRAKPVQRGRSVQEAKFVSHVERAMSRTSTPPCAWRVQLVVLETMVFAHSVVLAKSRTVFEPHVVSVVQEERELVECAHSVLTGASQTRSQSPVSNARQVVPVSMEHASSVPQVSR